MAGKTALARHLDDLAADLLDLIWSYEAERRPLKRSERDALGMLESRVAWLKALAAQHAAPVKAAPPTA